MGVSPWVSSRLPVLWGPQGTYYEPLFDGAGADLQTRPCYLCRHPSLTLPRKARALSYILGAQIWKMEAQNSFILIPTSCSRKSYLSVCLTPLTESSLPLFNNVWLESSCIETPANSTPSSLQPNDPSAPSEGHLVHPPAVWILSILRSLALPATQGYPGAQMGP